MDVCATNQQSYFINIKEENEDQNEGMVAVKEEYDDYESMELNGQIKNEHNSTQDYEAQTNPLKESSSTVRRSGRAVKKRTYDDEEDDYIGEEDGEIRFRYSDQMKVEDNRIEIDQNSFTTKSENSDSEYNADEILNRKKSALQRKRKKKKIGVKKQSSYKYTQDDMDKAIEEYKKSTGEFSLRGVADKYNIPCTTFRAKLYGILPRRCGHSATNRLLTVHEEDVFANYIKGATKRAMPLTKNNVLGALEDILLREQVLMYARNCAKRHATRERWWRNFKVRHPEIVYRSPETLITARRNLSQNLIRQWFNDIENYLSEKGMEEILLDPSRIFNLDEKGFLISPKTGNLLGMREEKLYFEEKEKSQYAKPNISVLCTIGADGSLPPPMIIYPQKNVDAEIAEQYPENYDFVVGRSEKGYITFESLYDYIANIFNKWLEEKNVKRPVLIYTDWHETKANVFLAKQLTELGIMIFGLLPNTTGLLQPLDKAVFKPLQINWATAAKKFSDKNPDIILNQTYFAMVALPLIFEKVTNVRIASGFSKCGLYPFDANKPDYDKLTAEVIQSNKREFGTMTEPEAMIKKKVQRVTSTIHSDVKRIVYPSLEKQTKDDMFLYLKKYEPFRSISLDVKKFYTFQKHLVEPLNVV